MVCLPTFVYLHLVYVGYFLLKGRRPSTRIHSYSAQGPQRRQAPTTRDWKTYKSIIGKFGKKKKNSHRELLLNVCAQQELSITNTFFFLFHLEASTLRFLPFSRPCHHEKVRHRRYTFAQKQCVDQNVLLITTLWGANLSWKSLFIAGKLLQVPILRSWTLASWPTLSTVENWRER